jgi:protein TonB
MKDYYKILGVSDTAEVEVIAAAYRALMHKYHPDTNPGPSSAEKAKEINEAYEVLCDAGRRRNYDQQRQTGEGGQSQEQERVRQERERERKEQTERQKREQDAQAREQQERERQERIKREREQQEREAHAKKMASSGGKSDNKAAPFIPAKSFYRSQLLLLGFPVVAGLVIIGLTSTDQASSVQSATKINDESYDRRAAYAFETNDFSVLRDLANKGHSAAQFYLGLAYDKGDGVTEDDVVAVNWYQRAADQGNVKAQYNLGVMHATGQGVPQYYAAAVEWFRKAAEQGDVRGQYRLGLAYSTGTGVDRDYVQAHKWLNLAAAGAKDVEIRDKAAKSRDWVASKMSSASIAGAQQLADIWRRSEVNAAKRKSPRAVSLPKAVPATPSAARPEPSVPTSKPVRIVSEPKASPAAPTVSLSDPLVRPSGATPSGNANTFTFADYPSASRAAREEGVASASYVIGVDGRVTQCNITQSSGFKRLDDATCSIIQRRFRFNPASRNGLPIVEPQTGAVSWSLTAGISILATPRGRGNVFSDDDYPSASRVASEQGLVIVSYVVGVDGRVTQCDITQSSGFKRLDDATCSIIQRRFRFNPATLNGRPVPERKSQPVNWRLWTPVAAIPSPTDVIIPATPQGPYNILSGDDYPSASRRAGEEGVTRVSYVVGVDGRVSQCEVVQSSGFKRLDDATCSIITRRFRFNPATLNGQPVPERKAQPARWRLLSPVDYTPIGPFSCKATPAQLRALAAAKGGEDAAKVIQLVATGEKLCADFSKLEAGKKFARAAELLGTDLAALSTTSKK